MVTDAGAVLRSASLDNSQGGIVSAKGAAEIRTGSLNNSQKGGIGSGAGLALVADLVDNSQNGRITAKGAIDANLKAGSAGQRQAGQRYGHRARSARGELVNRAQGLIATPEPCCCGNWVSWTTVAVARSPAIEALPSPRPR